MKSRTKIWLGVGAFVVAGAGVTGTNAQTPAFDRLRRSDSTFDLAIARALRPATDFSAAKKQGGEHGEHGAKTKKEGGEAGEGGGEGGAKDGAKLPPDLDFALKIAQIRGHLLVGDELVKQGQWAAALPHFLHPSEELYGPIRGKLKDYQTPQFSSALKLLANAVKAKKGGDDYDKALKAVEEALSAADAGLKTKQPAWDSFAVETALELLKSATHEYEEAIVKGRIAKPVEYQDARGFVWQSEKMIESIAPALEKKNAEALKAVRDGFSELKKAWPAAMAPKTPVKDTGAVLSDVSRIELSVSKLM
jgi:tetratricopeptide (TPR) repeat protein